jgi:hypothetical protein
MLASGIRRSGNRYLWLMCGLAALAMFSNALYTTGDLMIRVFGVRVTARILERGVRRVHEQLHSHIDDFAVRVEFSDQLGRQQETLVSLARAQWSIKRVGEGVSIAYDPAQPTRAVSVDQMGNVDHVLLVRAAWGFPLLLLAFGLRSYSRRADRSTQPP